MMSLCWLSKDKGEFFVVVVIKPFFKFCYKKNFSMTGLQVYFDMIIIISLFARKSVSTDIFRFHLVKRILFCRHLESLHQACHDIFLSDMYFTRIKRLDGNLLTAKKMPRIYRGEYIYRESYQYHI
jgi:hypothetical protein